jgi:hypothetical protein
LEAGAEVEQVDVNIFMSDEPGEQMLGELDSGEVVVFLLTKQIEQLINELVMNVERVVTVVCVVDDVSVMVTEKR